MSGGDIVSDNYLFMYHRSQSGVVLENLDQALAEQGLMVPLDLGAKVMIKVVIKQ